MLHVVGWYCFLDAPMPPLCMHTILVFHVIGLGYFIDIHIPRLYVVDFDEPLSHWMMSLSRCAHAILDVC